MQWKFNDSDDYEVEKLFKFKPIANVKDNPFYKKLIKTEDLQNHQNSNNYTIKTIQELNEDESNSDCISEGNTPTP